MSAPNTGPGFDQPADSAPPAEPLAQATADKSGAIPGADGGGAGHGKQFAAELTQTTAKLQADHRDTMAAISGLDLEVKHPNAALLPWGLALLGWVIMGICIGVPDFSRLDTNAETTVTSIVAGFDATVLLALAVVPVAPRHVENSAWIAAVLKLAVAALVLASLLVAILPSTGTGLRLNDLAVAPLGAVVGYVAGETAQEVWRVLYVQHRSCSAQEAHDEAMREEAGRA